MKIRLSPLIQTFLKDSLLRRLLALFGVESYKEPKDSLLNRYMNWGKPESENWSQLLLEQPEFVELCVGKR